MTLMQQFSFYTFHMLFVSDEVYTRKSYFQALKKRWATNFDQLEKYYMKIKIRFNETGEYMKKFEHYPNYYR